LRETSFAISVYAQTGNQDIDLYFFSINIYALSGKTYPTLGFELRTPIRITQKVVPATQI
jgi:hypothetical protein